MVTAAGDVATVQAAMRHGALQYLVKPFTFAGLRTKLEAYAALRRTLDRAAARRGRTGPRWTGSSAPCAPRRRRAPDLPKGHSPTTAELVRQVAAARADGPLSAQEIADRDRPEPPDRPALSQATWSSTGRVRLTLKYGDTGRPEHRYAWAARA